MSRQYQVYELADILSAKFVGDGAHYVHSIASLEIADREQISFLANTKFKSELDTTHAGCVLLSEKDAAGYKGTHIIVSDPYLAYAKVAQILDTTPIPPKTIHPTAQIADNVSLGKGVSIGVNCVLEEGAIIGDNAIIGANVVIGKNSEVGAKTRIFPNTTVYHDVVIGQSCLVHAGAVIGADGFGFANESGDWVKIPQLGGVIIGDNVEIGANSCIDRGALKSTIIGNGVKLDNFCHIAHNVKLGKNVAMAAYAGVAGSTNVGDYSTFSGRTTILGHLDIAPGTHVTACSVINKSNKEPGVFSSGTGMQDNKSWRRNVARFRQLDDMAKQLKQLEKQLSAIQSANKG